MLAFLEQRAVAEGRTLLNTETFYPGDAPTDGAGHDNADFLTHRGYVFGLGDVHRRLELPADPALLDRLADEAAPHHAAYETRTWRGRVPDELVESFATINASLMTEAPVGEVEREPEVADVAVLREEEAFRERQGRRALHRGRRRRRRHRGRVHDRDDHGARAGPRLPVGHRRRPGAPWPPARDRGQGGQPARPGTARPARARAASPTTRRSTRTWWRSTTPSASSRSSASGSSRSASDRAQQVERPDSGACGNVLFEGGQNGHQARPGSGRCPRGRGAAPVRRADGTRGRAVQHPPAQRVHPAASVRAADRDDRPARDQHGRAVPVVPDLGHRVDRRSGCCCRSCRARSSACSCTWARSRSSAACSPGCRLQRSLRWAPSCSCWSHGSRASPRTGGTTTSCSSRSPGAAGVASSWSSSCRPGSRSGWSRWSSTAAPASC